MPFKLLQNWYKELESPQTCPGVILTKESLWQKVELARYIGVRSGIGENLSSETNHTLFGRVMIWCIQAVLNQLILEREIIVYADDIVITQRAFDIISHNILCISK